MQRGELAGGPGPRRTSRPLRQRLPSPPLHVQIGQPDTRSSPANPPNDTARGLPPRRGSANSPPRSHLITDDTTPIRRPSSCLDHVQFLCYAPVYSTHPPPPH